MNFYRNLSAYQWNISLDGGIQGSFDGENFSQERNISVNFGKVVYDGGVYPLLEKELEIVSYLEREKFLNAQQLVELTAVSNYATKFYHQQLENFISEQLQQRKKFLLSFEEMYRKGVKISRYALLTERREVLSLEEEFLKEKSAHQKADIEFRTFGKLHTPKPIEVLPFRVSYSININELEKKALSKSHILNVDRYRIRDSFLRFEIERRKKKPLVEFRGNLGISSTRTSKFNCNLGIEFSYPYLKVGKEKEDC